VLLEALAVERHQIRHHQSLLLLVISARTHERPLLLHASSFTLQPRWDTCPMKTFTGHRRRRPWPALRDRCSCAYTARVPRPISYTVHRTVLIPRAPHPFRNVYVYVTPRPRVCQTDRGGCARLAQLCADTTNNACLSGNNSLPRLVSENDQRPHQIIDPL